MPGRIPSAGQFRRRYRHLGEQGPDPLGDRLSPAALDEQGSADHQGSNAERNKGEEHPPTAPPPYVTPVWVTDLRPVQCGEFWRDRADELKRLAMIGVEIVALGIVERAPGSHPERGCRIKALRRRRQDSSHGASIPASSPHRKTAAQPKLEPTGSGRGARGRSTGMQDAGGA